MGERRGAADGWGWGGGGERRGGGAVGAEDCSFKWEETWGAVVGGPAFDSYSLMVNQFTVYALFCSNFQNTDRFGRFTVETVTEFLEDASQGRKGMDKR